MRRTIKIPWLGRREFIVEDARAEPGEVAFLIHNSEDTFRAKVKKGTELEGEIAELISAS